MLRNNHIPIIHIRLQPLINLNTPRPLLKRLVLLLPLLHSCGVVPPSKKARLHLLMQTVVDGDFVGAGRGYQFLQVGDGVCVLDAVGEEAIELAFWVEEVVVGVDYDDGGVGWCHYWVIFGELMGEEFEIVLKLEDVEMVEDLECFSDLGGKWEIDAL